VDALSTLLLAIVFLISVFMVGQFFLSQELSSRDTVLDRLNRQISELTDLLSLERSSRRTIQENLNALQTTLQANEAERNRLQGLIESGGTAQARANELNTALETERQTTGRALSQIEILNQQIAAMRQQLAALEQALEASETRDNDSQARIADLGSRLNIALAQRVQELARYRSDFFGRLRQILGNRQDVRIVGDRFVFQSEVLFPVGQAVLRPEASGEIDRIASALIELEKQIPPDIPWVIRVDGHTDNRPIFTAQFPSNWALSASRAIAVVQALVARGVQPRHLVAAGFGEFQPLDLGTSEEAFARNRRIELKMTER
jgi:chemotaxis protein MotB